MPGGRVNQQIGQEFLIRAKNNSSGVISNGGVVYQVGFESNRPLIDTVDNVLSDCDHPLGFATESITNTGSRTGFVCNLGYVRDYNSSGLTVNQCLYAPTNGAIAVTNKYGYPIDSFHIGRVAKVHATEGIVIAETPHMDKTWSELDEQYKTISDTNIVASISNVGKMRYYSTASNSFVDISMQTGASSFSWVNIQQYSW
jgi:hypothetical protein